MYEAPVGWIYPSVVDMAQVRLRSIAHQCVVCGSNDVAYVSFDTPQIVYCCEKHYNQIVDERNKTGYNADVLAHLKAI